MRVQRIFAMDQSSDQAEELAIKNGTTRSICGYVVCAMCEYLAEQDHVTEELLKNINFYTLKPYIEKAMQTISKSRKMEVKKFMSKMTQNDRKSYMTDWVANFELADYLDSISEKVINHQLFFWRQSSFDHPQAMEKLKYQEAERVKQEQQFKGQLFFYSSFNPFRNNSKQKFCEEIKKCHESKLPIIIATDVLGHFNTTVIMNGIVYVLDSLPFVEGQYDSTILEAICYIHKESYLKK